MKLHSHDSEAALAKKRSENGHSLRAGPVNELLNRCAIDNIENGLVACFIEKYDVQTKNRLINSITRKAKETDKEKIRVWFDENHIELNLKNLERIFELLIEAKDRKLNGAFYTPKFIVDYIVDKTITEQTRNVCDCSCGSGAFLMAATTRISSTLHKPIADIIEECVYGVDISERNVNRTKIMLTLLMLMNGEDRENLSFNLKASDSLTFDWRNEFPAAKKGFDAVIGNPPYVIAKNLPEHIKQSLHRSASWVTAPSGKADLFIPFTELGVNLINDEGVLGYVIPNTFFTSLASRRLRQLLQNWKLVREIVDFDHLQIFQDATIYTCIAIIDKQPKSHFNYVLIEDEEKVYDVANLRSKDFIRIDFDRLDHKKWALLDEIDRENIIKIETIGEPLKSVCKIRTGMSTLRNHLYAIRNAELNEDGYYQKDYRGKTYLIEKEITREILKSGRVKDEEYVKNNTMRIIFPYQKDKTGRMNVISPKTLMTQYPYCYKYFLAIRPELEKRDKGKKEYETWYAYGRTQGLENDRGPKLIMPDMESKPRFVLSEKDGVLFITGYGLWLNEGKSLDLQVLKKILSSKVFAYYMNKTSRRYQKGYRSYAKHFVENFSIPHFTDSELEILRTSSNVDEMLVRKYQLKI